MKITSRSLKLLSAVTLSASALVLMAWITPANYYQLINENDFIRSLKQKLTLFNQSRPQDRLYVQFDKPMYEPGDNIWFSAFVRDASTMKASSKSDIVHVELINPKGTVEKTINIIAKNGVAAGDFSLDQEALGGMYKVRAYTNWMKNEGENNAFEKQLQVQDVVLPNLKMKLDFEKKAFGPSDEVVAKLELNTNENKPLGNYKVNFVANLDGKQLLTKQDITDADGLMYIKFSLPKDLKTNDGLLNVMIEYNGTTESISRSIPIVLNKIKLQLLPEGGDLVSGLQSKVAFRALNEFDKPADIEGVVVNKQGKTVAAFSSYHQGMGAFDFTPQANENYTVKITRPENINETYSLPEVLTRGYVMNVDNSKKGEIALTISTTETEELSVVAQVRNKIYYASSVATKKGTNKLVFPTAEFPIGVAQITLFDSKGIERAERLAFVNKDKQLSISVQTEKEKYLPREKVKMSISVKDERGIPMPANLSMAVVNDQFLSFADDKSGNVLSQLLLQQDINEKIEEPAFYFDKKEAKADLALDYLLMTAGWRHFKWEQIIEQDGFPQIAYAGERAIVAGKVLDATSGKIISNASIKVANGVEYKTDENGKFIFNKLDLTTPSLLTYSANGYTTQSQYVYAYNQDLTIYLYCSNYYKNYPMSSRSSTVNDDLEFDRLADIPASVAEGAGVQKAVMKFEAKPKDIANKKNVNNVKLPVGRAKEAVKEQAKKSSKQLAIHGKINAAAKDDRFAREAEQIPSEDLNIQQQVTQVYYRAKEFAAPIYDKQENVETRTDFRNTIYWNPNIEIDKTGKKTIEFYTSDDITSFRATLEGIATDGTIGRIEKTIFTQLPFAITTKLPIEVATEDNLSIPLTFKNNTDKPLGGLLTITAPDGLKSLVDVPTIQTIMPGVAKTIYLDYKVLDKIGYGDFTIAFKACGLGDAITQKIKIVSKGFPVQASFSGQEVENEFSFEINHLVNGSLTATFTAFPNVVSDLMKGVEGILREPYGCFEQTSCTAYPNAMVLDYLKSTDSKDNKTLANATDLLNRGYKRLITFETKEKGYEWFGANPAHEGLTAYGIMEFVDMKNAGADVDQKMLDRTVEWLLKRKDGNGGFHREKHAYHDFGSISNDVLNAYIVYALAEAGYSDIKKEFETSLNKALSTKDAYLLAMMANAAYSLKETTKAEEAMASLLKLQEKNGSYTGNTHSITYSQGQSLTIETTSLAVLALLKSGKNASAMNCAVQYLVGARSGSGVFSSTQGTILALKALTEYAKFSKKTTEDGTILLYVDGKKVAEKSYKAGDKGAIEMADIEQFIKTEGKHTIKVKYVGVKTPLPYSVALNWNTTLPNSDKECSIDLNTKLAVKSAKVGETVRLTSVITNKKDTEVPSTMAIIGIPAGFTVQPWQLKELQEKHIVDYYEIKGNNIAVYYRGMGANAVKEINLDLKAEIPGEYDAPASSAYLYYTNEFKTWTEVDRVTIKKS
ncbi:MAG: MG2 domain-containing protein [Bacteroidia bacterium]